MSANTFQLAGTAGGAGNGYWLGGGSLTLTLANTINFTFETIPNSTAGKKRLTIEGTWTQASAALGFGTVLATIPIATIPVWARPSFVHATQQAALTSCSSDGFVMLAQTYAPISLSRDATFVYLSARTYIDAPTGPSASTVRTIIEYF